MEVAITFTGSRLRLTSDGAEIGEWDQPMYQLTRVDESEFVFSAEGHDLTLRPLQPNQFADAARNGTASTDGGTRQESTDAIDTPVPPARPLTLLLFYILAAGTAAMGAWALMTIIG